MDNLFAIACGLGLRVLVDVVSRNDFRVGGSIVGLWEGVVLYHFLNKMPSSFDPYVAYGIRLFVDFLFTESLYRLMLVVLWTGLGLVLSDIGPVIWYDSGMQHSWNRFRRGLSFSIFTKNPISSRVRFHTLPARSRASSFVSSSRSIEPSVAPSSPQSIHYIPPPRERRKSRIVPGSFPGDWSETETDRGSISGLPPLPQSVLSDDASDITEMAPNPADLPDTLSSEPNEDPSAVDPVEIPDVEEAPLPDKDLTPKQNTVVLPPTPADSLRNVVADTHEVQPSLADTPVIPDTFDGGITEGWEKVDINDESERQDAPNDLPIIPSDPPSAGPALTTFEVPLITVDEAVPEPTSNNDNRTPPPSFQDVYGEDNETKEPSDRASIPESKVESILPEDNHTRLQEALQLRKKAAVLSKEIDRIRKEGEQAKTDGKKSLALAKKVEGDKKEAEMKRLRERATRRFWTVHNSSESLGEINLEGLEGDEAVLKTEEALEQLLRPEEGSAEVQGGSQLRVNLGNGSPANRAQVKNRIMAAMKSHSIPLTEDPYDSRIITICLPNTDES